MSETASEIPVPIELNDSIENKNSPSVKTSPTEVQNTEELSKRKAEELSDDDMKIEIPMKKRKIKVTSPVTPSPLQETFKVLSTKEQLKEYKKQLDELLEIERRFSIPKIPKELIENRPKPKDLSEYLSVPSNLLYYIMETWNTFNLFLLVEQYNEITLDEFIASLRVKEDEYKLEIILNEFVSLLYHSYCIESSNSKEKIKIFESENIETIYTYFEDEKSDINIISSYYLLQLFVTKYENIINFDQEVVNIILNNDSIKELDFENRIMVLYNVSTLIYDCDNIIDYIKSEVDNQQEKITKHLSYINSEKEKLKEIKQQKKSINNDINELSSTILEDNKIFEISSSYLYPNSLKDPFKPSNLPDNYKTYFKTHTSYKSYLKYIEKYKDNVEKKMKGYRRDEDMYMQFVQSIKGQQESLLELIKSSVKSANKIDVVNKIISSAEECSLLGGRGNDKYCHPLILPFFIIQSLLEDIENISSKDMSMNKLKEKKENYLNKASTNENNIRTKALGSDYCNNRYWYFSTEPNMIFVEEYDENMILSNNKKKDVISLIDPLTLVSKWSYYDNYDDVEKLQNNLFIEGIKEEKLHKHLEIVMPKIKLYQNVIRKQFRKVDEGIFQANENNISTIKQVKKEIFRIDNEVNELVKVSKEYSKIEENLEKLMKEEEENEEKDEDNEEGNDEKEKEKEDDDNHNFKELIEIGLCELIPQYDEIFDYPFNKVKTAKASDDSYKIKEIGEKVEIDFLNELKECKTESEFGAFLNLYFNIIQKPLKQITEQKKQELKKKEKQQQKKNKKKDVWNDKCEICKRKGNLLCCETCPRVYHKQCVGLKSIPKGDWFCPVCSK